MDTNEVQRIAGIIAVHLPYNFTARDAWRVAEVIASSREE